MKINVKKIVEEKSAKIKSFIKEVDEEVTVCIIQVEGNYGSDIYVRNKVKKLESLGINVKLHKLPENCTKEQLNISIIFNGGSQFIDGILLQLPLPDHLKEYEQEFIDLIPERKDIDRLTTTAQGMIALGNIDLLPCTVQGIIDIINNTYEGNAYHEREFLIFGRSKLVGMPLSIALTHLGGTVKTIHTKSPKIGTEDRIYDEEADVVISAVGIEDFINLEILKRYYASYEGTFIDVGINRNKEGKVCGDISNTHVFEDSAWTDYTTVPGGVGPTTVLNVAYNTLKLVYGNEVKF